MERGSRTESLLLISLKELHIVPLKINIFKNGKNLKGFRIACVQNGPKVLNKGLGFDLITGLRKL